MLADHELPLLVKFLFAAERLSVQVHPDEGDQDCSGKSEMWYLLETAPDSTIGLGFRQPLSREGLLEATRSGTVESLINWMPVKAGESYLTPAHTVHAIGAGIVLCEIQQNCDVTYRLWDYGRPRPLHITEALPLADLTVHPGRVVPKPIGPGSQELVNCKYFVVELVELAAGETVVPEPRPCQLWVCLRGAGAIAGDTYRGGEVWLMPDEAPQPTFSATSPSTFLRTYIPAR
jgi:mannose-6-phosphate isomerase